MPRRRSWGSSASSTSGTASSAPRKSPTSPTAPRTCPATSSPGWTITSTCSEGQPSGPWRPARSASWTCSHAPPLSGRVGSPKSPGETVGTPRQSARTPRRRLRGSTHSSLAYLFLTTILLFWGGWGGARIPLEKPRATGGPVSDFLPWGGGGFRSFRPCSDPCDCPRGPPAPRARGVWCAVCPPPAATLRGGHVPCVLSTPCRPLSGQPRGSPQPPARPLSSCSLCCASFYPRTLQAGGAGRLRRQCPGLEGGLGMDDGRGSHPFSSVASPSDQCFVIDYGSERPPLSTGAKSSAAAFTTIPCGLGNSFSPAEKNSH